MAPVTSGLRRAGTTLAAGLALAASVLVAPAAAQAGDPARPVHPAHPEQSASTPYYVDCSAATNGDGSLAAPYNSLAAANAVTYGPGDRLYFKRGATCQGQLKPTGSGAAGNPVRVSPYGSGGARPVIEGGGTVYAAVHLLNVEQWEISGLEVTNKGATDAERNGILVELADHGTGTHYVLDDVYVHDVNGGDTKSSNGIQFRVSGTTTPTRFDDVLVENSEVYKVDREGLTTMSSWNCRAIYGCTSGPAWTASTRVVFRGNKIHDIGGDGMVVRATRDALVEHNEGYDIWMRSAGNNAGFWTINSDGTVFQYNEVHHVRRPGLNDGMAFDADFGTRGAVFQYNYSHDNQGGFLLLCGACGGGANTAGTVARYNLSVNDGSRILYAVGDAAAQMLNNTFYMKAGSTTAIVESSGGASTTLWANNIIYNLGTGGYGGIASQHTWRNNVMYGNHPASEPADPGKVTADPQLAAPGSADPAGYQLKAGSPARGAGMVSTGSGGKDYFGGPAPVACRPDIGAHQASAFDDAACSGGTNLVANPGFEAGGVAPWAPSGTVALDTVNPHSGGAALRVSGYPSTAEQKVTVEPNTTYTLSGWGRVDAYDTQLAVGVKNFGGTETRIPAFTAFGWKTGSITFTTGATNTSATLYCYTRTGKGSGWCDDLRIVKQ